jgi:hypothetical protein
VYSGSVAAVAEIARAFGADESYEGGANDVAHGVEGARSGRTQDRFEFREAEFDRVEVRTVRRQKPQRRTDASDGAPNVVATMRAEVVENDEVAGPERGHEDLFDIGEKAVVIHGPIDHARCGQALEAQGGDEGARMPAAVRRVIAHALAARPAAVAPQQVCGDATLIEKDQVGGIELGLQGAPRLPGRRDVSAIVFGGTYGFF